MLLQTKHNKRRNAGENMTITAKNKPLKGLMRIASYGVNLPLTNMTHEFFARAKFDGALDYVIHKNVAGSEILKKDDDSSKFDREFLSFMVPVAYFAWLELKSTVNPHMKKMIEWQIGNDADNYGMANRKKSDSNFGCSIQEFSADKFHFSLSTGKDTMFTFHFDIVRKKHDIRGKATGVVAAIGKWGS